MKYYAEYLERRETIYSIKEHQMVFCKPFYFVPCGSDSYFILDGRNSLDTMIMDATTRLFKLQKIHPSIRHFNIRKGNFKNSVVIYSTIKEEG